MAIDCETSDLPRPGVNPWPVAIAAVVFDFNGRNYQVIENIIAAEGRSISPDATAIHGITKQDSERNGISETLALANVHAYARKAKYIVAYNADFDRAILESALIRLGKPTTNITRPGLQWVDLMKPSTPFCRVPSGHDSGQYKWPSLDTAMGSIRKERPRTGKHDVLRDALAAKRLFLSLVHRRALDIPEAA